MVVEHIKRKLCMPICDFSIVHLVELIIYK